MASWPAAIQVTRELVEGEVVETSESESTGSFTTEAVQTSITTTDTDGVFHLEAHPYTWPGPGPGPSSTIAMEADETFSDHHKTTNTMASEQSGSYGDEETDTSSSNLTLTYLDEFSSEMEGASYWTDGTVEMVTEYSSEQSRESTYTSSTSEEYSPEGNEASWSTSYEYETSWNYHTETTVYGYTTIFDDTGDDSGNNDSGPNNYSPNNNPSQFYVNMRYWKLLSDAANGDPPGAEDAAGPGAQGATNPPPNKGSKIGGLLGSIAKGLTSAAKSLWGAMTGGR